MDIALVKELGAIIIEVAKNGGANAVQIFAIIYLIDLLKFVIGWGFVLAIGKGLYSLFHFAVSKTGE